MSVGLKLKLSFCASPKHHTYGIFVHHVTVIASYVYKNRQVLTIKGNMNTKIHNARLLDKRFHSITCDKYKSSHKYTPIKNKKQTKNKLKKQQKAGQTVSTFY